MAANQAKYPGDTSWPQPDAQYLTGQEIQVPDVSNQSVSNATAALQAAGFQAKKGGSTPSDTVPKGSVVSTDPAAGSSAIAGSLVKLTISSGPQAVQPTAPPSTAAGTVPQVTGAPLGQAISMLGAAGYGQTNVTYVQQPGQPCSVVSQSPGGNTQADPASTTVQLSVAGSQALCQSQPQPGQ